jgi:pimeloyl-ACP methyl ester carboxylesterase
VVGHDWGGIVAWWLAIRRPELLARLTVLNAPHPIVFRRYLRSSPRQLRKSWYAFSFQLPLLPEAMLRRQNWRPLTEALRATSRAGTFTEADLESYRGAWSARGAITAMIHWYRAALWNPPRPPSDARIHVPTLLIWGAKDVFLDRGLARLSIAPCNNGRLELFEDATHWLQHEEPARVNRLLLEFLRAEAGPPSPGREGPGT